MNRLKHNGLETSLEYTSHNRALTLFAQALLTVDGDGMKDAECNRRFSFVRFGFDGIGNSLSLW